MSVVLLKQFRRDRLRNLLAYFFLGRPEITQVDVLTIDICGDRLVCLVDIHRAGQRVSYDQGLRSQENCPHPRVDAPFKNSGAPHTLPIDKADTLYGPSPPDQYRT